MKKSELNLIKIGNLVESKKTNEILVINNIVEVEGKVKYELSNGKTTTQSSLVRWYNLILQPTPIEQVEVENEEQPPVEPTPQPTPVEVKPNNNLVNQIFEYCNNHQELYTVKHNKDHSVIKSVNNKNLVEIYASKKAVNIAVRHALYNENEQMILDNCRIVGSGTFTLDLKFIVHTVEEFIDALNRASNYTPTKSKK